MDLGFASKRPADERESISKRPRRKSERRRVLLEDPEQAKKWIMLFRDNFESSERNLKRADGETCVSR